MEPSDARVKLWHDDIRSSPDGWEWARTNEAAQAILIDGDVDEISLDHDLGLDHLDPHADPEAIYFAGRSPRGTGLDLVWWMVENKLVPAKVTIHSWNPDGAQTMARVLNGAGYDCVVSPFQYDNRPRDSTDPPSSAPTPLLVPRNTPETGQSTSGSETTEAVVSDGGES